MIKRPSAPAQPPGEYKLDDQVGYVLRQVSQRHTNLFQDRAPDGLTPTQFSALVRLAEVGPCSQNHLGRLTSMDVATIKGVVDRLHRKGFVSLSADTEDKRRSVIALTDLSLALIDELHSTGHDITAATLRPLTADEQKQLLKLLRKLT
ncbi:MarR family winged helix-turn-helix transcriptional regulator [Pseudoruegeria sp. SK021]|uniref:MarR family winged helix-turn-helix transcriptional regulator n=1 Tax=Pseudoruegeria sp. SK021 TaxID=1933035 RepID=UPI000A218F19|nr:MarR family transcriptional regulator [Pseudoruegeria sp. SK021]OSP55868.1 MarR family transcriptional regulator [Pseudoruegeria sp. SK021]